MTDNYSTAISSRLSLPNTFLVALELIKIGFNRSQRCSEADENPFRSKALLMSGIYRAPQSNRLQKTVPPLLHQCSMIDYLAYAKSNFPE